MSLPFELSVRHTPDPNYAEVGPQFLRYELFSSEFRSSHGHTDAQKAMHMSQDPVSISVLNDNTCTL